MSPPTSQQLMLLILDGWGLAPQPQYSAIDQAHTPFIDGLYQHYPHSRLAASGTAVGLPLGQVGNSEVGHINLGAGRVVDQSLVRINKALASGAWVQNEALCSAFNYAKTHHRAVHLMGLVSDGGVHAHLDHLKALCKAAQQHALDRVWIHAFTDGRDTAPQSALQFLTDLEQHLQATTGQLASIMGRYYAMDRDQRWERTQVAYNALVHGQGKRAQDWHQALQQAYAQGITDEFLLPMLLTDRGGGPKACLVPGDVVICFNFRTDRSRQITHVLTQAERVSSAMEPLELRYLTMTDYDKRFKNVQPLFASAILPDTLGEVLSRAGKTQLRISETEKYPHVTYFFSGGQEAPFPGEERILCPSPQVATYDQAPAMAAPALTAQVLPLLERQKTDFICLNFANPDMVGHTGQLVATIQACEIVDQCTAQIVPKAIANHYQVLIVADHGNADQMCDEHGAPHTAHTAHPVPCILIAPQHSPRSLKDGKLADIAPTILHCMGLPIPAAMTGNILIDL